MSFKWIAEIFNRLVRAFNRLMEIAFPIAKKIIMAKLQDIAVETVSKLEKTDLNNEQRRNQAFQEIQAYAARKGIEAGASLIYCIIESVLQFIKEQNK